LGVGKKVGTIRIYVRCAGQGRNKKGGKKTTMERETFELKGQGKTKEEFMGGSERRKRSNWGGGGVLSTKNGKMIGNRQ